MSNTINLNYEDRLHKLEELYAEAEYEYKIRKLDEDHTGISMKEKYVEKIRELLVE